MFSTNINFNKKLNKSLQGNKVIRYGTYREIYHNNKKLFVYEREYEGVKYLVVCNYSDKCPKFVLPDELKGYNSKLIMSNYGSTKTTLEDKITLLPYEGFVYELTK